MVSTARLGVVKQSFSGLPGQYGRHVTRANWRHGGPDSVSGQRNNSNVGVHSGNSSHVGFQSGIELWS